MIALIKKKKKKEGNVRNEFMDEREREISTFIRWIYDSTLHRNFIYERKKKNVKITLHTFQLVCNKLNFHFHFPMKLSFSSC